MCTLSQYAEGLPSEAKARYMDKISVIGGTDPFIGDPGDATSDIPPLEMCDLISYLVVRTSFVTSKQFKARKGLEGYNQFVNGWVKGVSIRKISGKYLSKGRVRHSQRLSEAPLSSWIIIEEDGEVCCAHCTCMAGLGETCTHVAAILFYLEALSRMKVARTPTEGPCNWVIPAYLKSAEYLPIRKTDFTSAKGKKRKLDQSIEEFSKPDQLGSGPSTYFDNESAVMDTTVKVTNEEMEILFKNLSTCYTKPAILSLIPPYSDNYVPKSAMDVFPKPLNELYNPDYIKIGFDELMDICNNFSISITEEMSQSIEKATRDQSKSNLWYKYRSGKVTASRMKAICGTRIEKPSKSLIKSICYPDAYSFSSKQTDWGHKQEKRARELYCKEVGPNHEMFEIMDSGLVINPQYPYLGASPDGIVSCSCCGKGVVELKCPYTHRDDTIKNAAIKDKTFCVMEEEGRLKLRHDHAYYYQIQTQMYVCDVTYCDFVVCMFGASFDIYIERVYQDKDLWEDCLKKAKNFFTSCLLPELLGHFYTRPTIESSEHVVQQQDSESECSTSDDRLYCYCHRPSKGLMIGCDNPDCKIEWFHTKCLGLKSIPKGSWYCEDCEKLVSQSEDQQN